MELGAGSSTSGENVILPQPKGLKRPRSIYDVPLEDSEKRKAISAQGMYLYL